MGSAASIDNRFSEELRQTYLLTEELKEQIATHDARFLKVQSSQAWKDHKKIITALTERTKSQLQRVARIYSKLEAEEGRNISADIEIRNMLGGSYGDFMRLLVVSVDAINSELLDTALKCIGCDENLVADVLCGISQNELIAAKNHYDDNHKDFTLYNIIKSKTLENSSYQKFILKILNNQRQSENIFSIDEAIQQVDALYEAGLTGIKSSTPATADDEIIFNILSKCSRQQCHLISEQFEKKYNITLEAGLTALYHGSCLRALILWVSPLLSAISSLFYMSLNSVVIDFDQTCHLATKYDKSILQKVIVTYEQIYSESLIDKLSKVLTGNFKKSVIAWFTNPTYDDGFESKISEIIESCDGSIDNLLADKTKLDALQNLIMSEHNSASTHLDETIAATSAEGKKSQQNNTPSSKSSGLPAPLLTGKSRKNISDNENNSPTTITESSTPPSNDNSSKDKDNEKDKDKEKEKDNNDKDKDNQSSKKHEVPIEPIEAAPAIIAKPSKRKQLGYEEKFQMICDYLLTRFKQDDIDDSGMLNSNEFWNTLKSLNVGYTEDELQGIQAWVDYDGDGEISYAEVINELADSLIDIIESSGMTVEDKVADLWEQNRIELAKLWDEYQNWAEQQDVGELQDMSPSLTQYLKDSFEAFDVDRNGTLDSAEFWNILVTLLGLSDGDRALMEHEWDDNNDGKISWEEALEEFNKIFRSKVNDKKDFWIGLVDRPTNKLFWFNVRDETSFWMTAEDEARFKEHLALGAGRSEVLAPAEVPSSLLSAKTKSFNGNMKSLREFKSIKKAMESDQ